MGDEYAHPEVLVSTQWVADHLNDPKVCLIECDVETSAYDQGHVPGAISWNWQTDLQDQLRRGLATKEKFEELCSGSGLSPETTVVVYGDNQNWFAAWALWQLKVYGHRDVRLMNGGRKRWVEEGRDLSKDKPNITPSAYEAREPDTSIRAFRGEVFELLGQETYNLVDVRSPDEFSGKIISPPGLPETAQRAGHIPGAKNIPWSEATNEDGTFKSISELEELYGSAGLSKDKKTIAYCRIGERSSHTWYVLKYLLGYEDVKNYDGSWTEWGNLIDAPIIKGTHS
ncbi:MAG: sulfurtransferase [Planctomycetota bacterium]|nr:sulfurtransferase [Planctomycetota bacterium]